MLRVAPFVALALGGCQPPEPPLMIDPSNAPTAIVDEQQSDSAEAATAKNGEERDRRSADGR